MLTAQCPIASCCTSSHPNSFYGSPADSRSRERMPLYDAPQSDLNAARKAQDKPRVLVLGTIFSDVKNRKIEVRRDLTDDEVIDVLRKGIKRRRESIEMYTG